MPEINYAVVYNTLKEQISRGDYPVDSLLPAEPELEKIWHTAYENDSQREQFCGRIFKYQDKNAVNRLLCLIFDKK